MYDSVWHTEGIFQISVIIININYKKKLGSGLSSCINRHFPADTCSPGKKYHSVARTLVPLTCDLFVCFFVPGKSWLSWWEGPVESFQMCHSKVNGPVTILTPFLWSPQPYPSQSGMKTSWVWLEKWNLWGLDLCFTATDLPLLISTNSRDRNIVRH